MHEHIRTKGYRINLETTETPALLSACWLPVRSTRLSWQVFQAITC